MECVTSVIRIEFVETTNFYKTEIIQFDRRTVFNVKKSVFYYIALSNIKFEFYKSLLKM
ncbi:hypothetical protein LEP1GSC034_1389 [Leptospira interrogans str. 2003000735]|nr:hypothetical protein LEP1GSC034_1389 [Leptospira interrogans str. 2003000735]EMN73771.1 hypothetical protein LEP1GSC100_4096 [Leptospira interrogans serovar Bataviae str. UI 08561]